MTLELSSQDLILLACALDSYMFDLSEREKRTEYWFRAHSLETYRQRAEENRILILSRMAHVDRLKQYVLSVMPN